MSVITQYNHILSKHNKYEIKIDSKTYFVHNSNKDATSS